MGTVEQQLREIVAGLGSFQPDFDPAAHFFRDLGVKSVKALELLFQIEETFALEMPDDDYNEVQNLNDLVKLVEKLQGDQT